MSRIENYRTSRASGLKQVIFSEKELLAAEQLLKRIRQASKYPDIDPYVENWGATDQANDGPAAPPDRGVLVEKARNHLFNRRHRNQIFKKGMFGEPAWEMLVVLYVGDQGRRYTIGCLIEVAGASMTTALRWLEFLEGEGFVQRRGHPTDRRAVFIELTDAARNSLDVYFSATR